MCYTARLNAHIAPRQEGKGHFSAKSTYYDLPSAITASLATLVSDTAKIQCGQVLFPTRG